MHINSLHFGELEIPSEEIIYFSEGICGFEDLKRWILLGDKGSENRDAALFMWLHSVEDPSVCFVVIDPFAVKKDYSPEVGFDTLSKVGTENTADLRFMAIVTMPEDIKKMTVNLKSPLVVNSLKNMAVQMVMDNDVYGFKHYLLDDSQKTV